ncbi:hypothetical protein BIW11_12011 [Tropilaelaps mercedesae]|uniref:Secreted protein n=1 Tax=Tropilaelaps mercedesae TaxID=418985 RepID=A0A1V9X8X5_9ACAR|nr:hypothetical protein BIW11_12011 [Tropilaelaps mercedesae]
MIVVLLLFAALAFKDCQAVDANSAVDALKYCAKDVGIKDDVVSKLESAIRNILQGGDQDASKFQDSMKQQANQVMNASGVGNKVADLTDCIADKLKD